jgi:TetR/AcrR family transcriptional regulator, transcriptional repressor for nem operon
MVNNKINERLLIREGYKLLRKTGYLNTNVDQIADNLNISKGTFYSYFKNKDEFVEAVLHYYVIIVLNRIDRTLSDIDLSPRQRLIKLYSDYIDHYINKGGDIYGNFADLIAIEIGDKNPKIQDKVKMFYSRMKNSHIDCLHAARRAGEIDKSHDSEKLAILIINSWEASISMVKTTGNIRSLIAFRELLRDFILR